MPYSQMPRHRGRTSLNHRPIPGPLYWDFRCMKCGAAVVDHPGFFARLMIRIAGRA